MKLIAVLLIVIVCLQHSFAECPVGQYHPGPNCSFEEICPLPSAHTYRLHYCDCWCIPPRIRDSVSHTCVEKCPTLSMNSTN
ncbi:hypothetical protein K1T71_004341 [Dendrolimus kikuchii]|uniref:Uncharacterized protein n=1 Tax=Dendrolimus kikuchii TaxID=765133 RepID=A0ACC1D7H0_9NEOP|nr:hypothetical protein K1T71_004341 [Dendrolimus kikuchii]